MYFKVQEKTIKLSSKNVLKKFYKKMVFFYYKIQIFN